MGRKAAGFKVTPAFTPAVGVESRVPRICVIRRLQGTRHCRDMRPSPAGLLPASSLWAGAVPEPQSLTLCLALLQERGLHRGGDVNGEAALGRVRGHGGDF